MSDPSPPRYTLTIDGGNIIQCTDDNTGKLLICPSTPVLTEFITSGHSKLRFYIDLIKDMLAGTPVTGCVSKLQQNYANDDAVFTDLTPSNYSRELKSMITRYEGRVKELSLGIFTEKQNEAKMSNGVKTKYSFATTTFPESGTHPFGVCVRQPDDISGVINTAWVLDTASGSSEGLTKKISNPNLRCDSSFTGKFGGFPDYFIWQTLNSSSAFDTNSSKCTIGLSIIDPQGTHDTLSINIDLDSGKNGIVGTELNGRPSNNNRSYSGFYAQGNNSKNQYINTPASTRDVPDILNIKESGDVAQVWMYYWYIIEQIEENYPINSNDINKEDRKNFMLDLLKKIMMITTDSVVYMLCLILNLPVLYTGSREGVTSGNCTVKMYVAGEPNPQNTFNILKAIKSKNIQDKNLSTKAIFRLLMDESDFDNFYYMKYGTRTPRKAQLDHRKYNMACVRKVCEKYIKRINDNNNNLTVLTLGNEDVNQGNFQELITQFDITADGYTFELCFSNDGFSSRDTQFLINNDVLLEEILGCANEMLQQKQMDDSNDNNDDGNDNGDKDNNNDDKDNDDKDDDDTDDDGDDDDGNGMSSNSNSSSSNSSSSSNQNVDDNELNDLFANTVNSHGIHLKAKLERSKNFKESYYECLLACVVLGDRNYSKILSKNKLKAQFLKEYDQFIANYDPTRVEAFMQRHYDDNNNEISDPDNYVLDVGGALVTEVLSSFSLEVPFDLGQPFNPEVSTDLEVPGDLEALLTHTPTEIDNYLNSLLQVASNSSSTASGLSFSPGESMFTENSATASASASVSPERKIIDKSSGIPMSAIKMSDQSDIDETNINLVLKGVNSNGRSYTRYDAMDALKNTNNDVVDAINYLEDKQPGFSSNFTRRPQSPSTSSTSSRSSVNAVKLQDEFASDTASVTDMESNVDEPASGTASDTDMESNIDQSSQQQESQSETPFGRKNISSQLNSQPDSQLSSYTGSVIPSTKLPPPNKGGRSRKNTKTMTKHKKTLIKHKKETRKNKKSTRKNKKTFIKNKKTKRRYNK